MKQISNIQEYFEAYEKSVNEPEAFWAEVAEDFTWKKKWDSVVEWEFETPSVKWFNGAQLNLTENCLDRHLKLKKRRRRSLNQN